MQIIINQKPVLIEPGQTILQAAEQLDIDIPTLCHMKGLELFTSCMVCMVQDMKANRLLPSCSALAQDGMVIETDNKAVHQARKDALDLLLSEHIGDCQAPCERGCPADMNIPLMLRQINQGNFRDALITVKQDIALPAALGRICPAPCEKVCNRGLYDQSLAICHLKKFVADVDLASDHPYRPPVLQNSNKHVAVIGAGPAGLAAAFYLTQKGHHATIFDDHDQAGGMLRYGVEETRLPRTVLDQEIRQITLHGVSWQLATMVGRAISFAQIRKEWDAVIVAMGTISEETSRSFGLEWSSRGVKSERATFRTNLEAVFCGGNAIGSSRMAVRAVSHGKKMAWAVDQFLTGQPVTGVPTPFFSRLGRLDKQEVQVLVDALADQVERSSEVRPTHREPVQESSRCLHCDCRKQNDCKFRVCCEEYDGEQARFKGERKKISLSVQHDLVIYEPGKCIKCGLCVHITEKAAEPLGLTFIGRGFDVQINVPFQESLATGLQKVAMECVDACPTAALALKTS